MKHTIVELLISAAHELRQRGVLPDDDKLVIPVERARDPAHGDFASGIALRLSKQAKMPPRELAARLVDALPASAAIEKAEIAGPGFINFTLRRTAYFDLIDSIRAAAADYGKINLGAGQQVLLEFVSANPTGPLHVGHGRGAACGDALARLLRAAGYEVHTEYYLNDAGRQMDILAVSALLRCLERAGQTVALPAGAYQGEYVRDIAAGLEQRFGALSAAALLDGLPAAEDEALDLLAKRAKAALGDDEWEALRQTACAAMTADIRADLEAFGVIFDRWFSERSLSAGGEIGGAVAILEENGWLYEQDGAQWFRATAFGDEKDRVVTRANGARTYFAADIAYHHNKARRGYDRIINILGADHHGYVKRIEASFAALGHDPARLRFVLVQFAALWRGDEKIPMSTRGGQFVTLRALRREVGNDACRFFYVSRRPEQHIDFDLELAKSQSADNPVYYIQYAHARIHSVFRRVAERGLDAGDNAPVDYSRLAESRELALLRALSRFPEVVERAADACEPHQVANYLRELADDFHSYYNAHPFLAGEPALRRARLGLLDAVRVVLANGLQLLGVSAPESM